MPFNTYRASWAYIGTKQHGPYVLALHDEANSPISAGTGCVFICCGKMCSAVAACAREAFVSGGDGTFWAGVSDQSTPSSWLPIHAPVHTTDAIEITWAVTATVGVPEYFGLSVRSGSSKTWAPVAFSSIDTVADVFVNLLFLQQAESAGHVSCSFFLTHGRVSAVLSVLQRPMC